MTRKELSERIKDGVLLFDGAIGTMLYANGIFINRCYDELNLSMPHLVKQIHQEYVAAGADCIETNTFGANRFKLSAYGYGDKLSAINAEKTAIKTVEPVPMREKSKLGWKLANREFVTSVEITPPRGCDPGKVLEAARQLKENNVDAVNIPDGPRALTRMSAQHLSCLIEKQEGIAIAREMVLRIKDHVEGGQVSAPMGKVQHALEVLAVIKK